MNYIWNNNITLFSKRFPQLYQLYKNQISEFEKKYSNKIESITFWQLKKAKNEETTATENNITLHSLYNPSREAQVAIQQIKDSQTIIFLGFGLGYHVIEAAKQIGSDKTRKLIIIESDIYRFFASLCILDWKDVFLVENLILALCCPSEQILPLIENQNKIGLDTSILNNAYIFYQKTFIQHDSAYFNSIAQLIERNKQKNEINSATSQKFLKLWMKNSINNINQIQNHRAVNEFLQDFKKQNINCEQIIIAAAGPSLEFSLPYLQSVQHNKIIICVETALHALLKNNISPDFIIITDPQYYAYKHLAGLQAPQSILIAPLSIHPAVFRFNAKEILLCSDKIPVSEYFEKSLSQEFGDLGTGGSVASCAWTLAKLLGAKKIIFAGLDLSYPKNETHIKGSSAEKTWHLESNRFSSVQKSNCNSIFFANPQNSVDYEGNTVLTDSRMKMFAWWFESQISKNPQIENYTLSSKSMKIPGVLVYDTIEKKSASSLKGELIFSNTNFTRTNFSQHKNNFFEALNQLQQLINEAIEKCIIDSPQIDSQLAQIDSKIEKNPLSELVRLAYKNFPQKIDIYTNLKRVLGI